MQAEHPDLLICAFSPGWLPTYVPPRIKQSDPADWRLNSEMGNQGAKWSGLERAPDDITKAIRASLSFRLSVEMDWH
jgi:hypothetical protein